MDKLALRNAVADCRAAWDATLAELGDEGLEAPGACDEWRVRDVLAHFFGWERFQLAHLRGALRGRAPSDDELYGSVRYVPVEGQFTEDKQNAAFFAANRDRPLADVVADWREVSDM